jgi:hypothetical protein
MPESHALHAREALACVGGAVRAGQPTMPRSQVAAFS